MSTVMQKARQKLALNYLENQLEKGVKTKKGSFVEEVPLTESDVKRINKEIKVLKEKI